MGAITYIHHYVQGSICNGVHVSEYDGIYYWDTNGMAHSLGGGLFDPNTCGWTSSVTNVQIQDGSGITYTADTSTPGFKGGSVTYPSGTVYNQNTISLTDSNGNQITSDGGYPTTTFTDTLGKVVLVYTTTTNPVTATYTYVGPTGANQTVTVNYTNVLKPTSAFNCPGIYEITNPTSNYEERVSSLVYPDGSQYSFTYETHTERIASITSPTSGVTSFTYPGHDGYTICPVATSIPSQLTSLTQAKEGGTWTYNRTQISGPEWQTNVLDPNSNLTLYKFQRVLLGYEIPFNFEVQRNYYNGANISRTVDTCYNGTTAPCGGTNFTMPITEIETTTTLSGGLKSKVSGFLNQYGLPVERDTYGFGPSVVSKTYIAYGSASGLGDSTTCSVLGNGIQNRPCNVRLYDVANVKQSQVTYTYDQGGLSGTTGTPNQVPVTGSRGNLTTTTKWTGGANQFSYYLYTYDTYFDTGNIRTSTTADGVVTNYTYGACGNSFLTLVSLPLSLSTSETWDSSCDGAVTTSTTDTSGSTSHFSYTDSNLWRPTSATDELNNVITLSYLYSGSHPVGAESSMLFNSSNSVTDIRVNYDIYGRQQVLQAEEGPSSSQYDSVETDYDAVGRVSRRTMPYQAAAGATKSTAPATTTTYDSLSRVLVTTDGGGGTITYCYLPSTSGGCAGTSQTNDVLITLGPAPAGEVVKQLQQEYDGLGRLTSVCKLSTATGSGPCGQTVAQTGYLAKYTYNAVGNVLTVSQNAQGTPQVVTFTYDSMGRQLTAAYPESGTAKYFYDIAPSSPGAACSPSTFNGQLVKTYDANGNTACYAYDGVNRVTSITYTGPNDDGNNKYFVYDSAAVNGVTMTGTAGRLAEAYTAPTSGGTKVTDEGFSYTARGEVADVYQSSPHSGGYYHTSATYFENGSLKVLSGVPGVAAWTFSIDGKGRPYSVIGGTSVSLANSVTYNSADQPLVTMLGLGDSDTYAYDGNTGRMSSYTFTIGLTPVSMVGNLTWNANGTLRQLAITDGVNAGGTQTCNYGTSSTPGYDELGRLVSVDCGAAIWQQNFSYDPFNNLTKSVPTGGTGTSWMPGYNQANNRYTLAGTSYDANGNLLSDTFHTYTWNQNNKVKSVVDSGATLTYDALGNMVEKSVGGVYTQILYSPIGRAAAMSGQTTTQWLLSLPGGGKAATGIQFWHADWLGTIRFASSKNGRNSVSDKAYAPYGEVYKAVVGGSVATSFTGDLQDIVSGTFDTPARELNPTQGRWLSPDSAHSGLNAYAYSINPLGDMDASGLQPGDPWEDKGPGYMGSSPFCCNDAPSGGEHRSEGSLAMQAAHDRMDAELDAMAEADGAVMPTPQLTVDPTHGGHVGAQKTLPWEIPALEGAPKEVGNWVIGLYNFGNEAAAAIDGTPAPTPVPEARASTPGERNVMAGVFLLSFFVGAGEERTLVSSIGKDKGLVRLAEEAGSQVQKGLDSLTGQLSNGNLNPGLGTKKLFGDISYARARDGARVFFRARQNMIEILAKASKHNEQQVIRALERLYK